tara:strand:+ start:238 stop:450 length:213 start_codon:yes stop_codon:yes gene_type:complete
MGEYAYDKTWAEIEDMLARAIRKQNMHLQMIQKTGGKERIKHMRNYKALEGVVKSLKWVLGDEDVQHPLE